MMILFHVQHSHWMSREGHATSSESNTVRRIILLPSTYTHIKEISKKSTKNKNQKRKLPLPWHFVSKYFNKYLQNVRSLTNKHMYELFIAT